MPDFKLTSSAFAPNTSIPKLYTCQGEDINPPLAISGIPKEAKTLVLIMDDPDAPVGTWDHWVLWNIHPVAEIEEDSVPPGSQQGLNSWGRNDYGGPCPPSGTHRYIFKLYALSSSLDLPRTANKALVEKAMAGRILAQTQLIGLYKKQ